MEPSRPDIDPEDSQSIPNPACEGLHYGYGLTVESCLDALLGLKAHDKRLERYSDSPLYARHPFMQGRILGLGL